VRCLRPAWAGFGNISNMRRPKNLHQDLHKPAAAALTRNTFESGVAFILRSGQFNALPIRIIEWFILI